MVLFGVKLNKDCLLLKRKGKIKLTWSVSVTVKLFVYYCKW